MYILLMSIPILLGIIQINNDIGSLWKVRGNFIVHYHSNLEFYSALDWHSQRLDQTAFITIVRFSSNSTGRESYDLDLTADDGCWTDGNRLWPKRGQYHLHSLFSVLSINWTEQWISESWRPRNKRDTWIPCAVGGVALGPIVVGGGGCDVTAFKEDLESKINAKFDDLREVITQSGNRAHQQYEEDSSGLAG